MKKERNNMTDNNPLYIIQKKENQLIKAVEAQLINKNQTPNIIEAPLSTGFDYGINLTSLASSEGLSPQELASQIASTIDGAEAVGSFLNFKLKMSEFGHQVVVDGDTPIKVERPTPTITKEDLEEMYRIGMSHPPSTLILCPRF